MKEATPLASKRMAVSKVPSDRKNHGVLLAAATVALGLAVLSVLHVNRTLLLISDGRQHSSPSGPLASSTMPLRNEEKSGKPEQFPYGMAKIAFERDDAIYLYDAQTRESRRLVEGYAPDISPAGDVIAFTADRDDSLRNSTIKLFNLQTNTTREFESLAKLNNRSPRWSHDGTKLAFNVIIDNRTHVGIMDVNTGEWDDVTKGLVFNDRYGVSHNSWSPDDESIVCQDLLAIYEISLNGIVLSRIPIEMVVPEGEVASSVRLQFSRDKRFLLFNGARKLDFTALYLFNLADQKLRRLTPKTMDGFDPVWLPSQDEIMFSRGRDEPSDFVSDLCVMSLSSGKVTTILKDAESGSYSTK